LSTASSSKHHRRKTHLFSGLVPAGIIHLPAQYLFGDVLTEFMVMVPPVGNWLGFACNLLAVIAIISVVYARCPFATAESSYMPSLASRRV